MNKRLKIGNHKIRKNLLLFLLLIILIIIVQEAWKIHAVRSFYFYDWYPFISHLQRIVFGWVPVSIGDLFYFFFALGILFWLVRLIIFLFHAKMHRVKIIVLLIRPFIILALFYFIFISCWGFNYHINRLQKSFDIRLSGYSKTDLANLCNYLAQRVNEYHDTITHHADDSTILNFKPASLFKESIQNYSITARQNITLRYQHHAVKSTMYGYWMDYLGIEGYYNPFTGEAQVNTTIPSLLLPFVTCHEISHQLGFAQEYAANFVGYYIANQSTDPRFVYSANFEILLYALGELRFRDSTAAHVIWNELHPGVKKDFRAIRNFYAKFNNALDPMMAQVYDRYLKANDQRNGIHSYDEVVALLINYRKKYH